MDQSRRSQFLGILVSAALGFACMTAAHADDYISYTGTATDLHSHEFLYAEQHVLASRNGRLAERVVLYTCRNGTPFARKTVAYVNSLAPDFELDDASNGLVEGIKSSGGQREVFFRAAANDAEKTKVLPNVPGLVADAGFDEFVRANWQALSADQTLSIRFLIPSRLEDMSFRIGELAATQAEGVPVDVFRLKLGGFFGWFLPGIDVYYGTQDRVLIRYVGISDLRNSSGDNMKVDITFNPHDRKPASAADLEKARQARLSPCA
jgi:hypothetical protein